MAENKTKPTNKSVERFLNQLTDEKKRQDAFKLLDIMSRITREKPVMWGDSLIGFGSYHYKYKSRREGDFFLTGFSPRQQNLTIYIMTGFNLYADLLKKLGKYKTGKSCLYIKNLENIDISVLTKIIKKSVAQMAKTYK